MGLAEIEESDQLESHTAHDFEESTLGALMLEKSAIYEIIDIIKDYTVFFDKRHQIVYQAILSLYEKREPIDILTVTKRLQEMGRLETVGGAYFITTLTNKVASTANLKYHARIMCQFYMQREYIKHSMQLHKMSKDPAADVFSIIDYNQAFNNKISAFGHAGNSIKIEDTAKELFAQIERQRQSESKLAGYSSGWPELDEITLGWQNGSFIVVAARPGEGKTMLGDNTAVHLADYEGIPVAKFSLEMLATENLARMLSADTSVPHRKIKTGDLNQYDLEKLHKSKVHHLPIYVYDNANLTINEIRAHAIRLYHEHGVRLIIVDYLQLMQGNRQKGGNREEEVSSISRGLKVLAKELNIPIIAMAQLNRASVQRGGAKIPQLQDLRESGSIEQDADTVIFIHRPEIHGFDTDEEGNSLKGVTQVIVAKNRHGSTGDLRLEFQGRYYRFVSAT